MAYSDDKLQFKIDLVDDLYAGMSKISTSGIFKIQKGDFSATYTKLSELQSTIDILEKEIYTEEGSPCVIKVNKCRS